MPDFRFRLPRLPLYGIPDVAILASVRAAKSDLNYPAAKGGDATQAGALVENVIGADQIDFVRRLFGWTATHRVTGTRARNHRVQ